MSEMLQLDQAYIKALWDRICLALPRRYSFLTTKPMEPMTNPGASSEDLHRLETFWRCRLPPSYSCLLSLFNGASKFAYTTPLLSTQEIIGRRQDWYVVDELNPELLNFVIAAGAESDLYFVFDPATQHADGEMDLIVYTADGNEERYPNIVEFMSKYLAALEAGIAREEADRSGLT